MTYTLAQIRQAGKEGEVNHLDVEHIIDLLKEQPNADREAIDMTAKEWFEKGSMFTLDFLEPEERETIYKIMDLYAHGKVRFQTSSLLKENEELKRLLHDLTPGGSEFYNDPKYCAEWVRKSREENHYALANQIKNLKSSNEAKDHEIAALKEQLKKLPHV